MNYIEKETIITDKTDSFFKEISFIWRTICPHYKDISSLKTITKCIIDGEKFNILNIMVNAEIYYKVLSEQIEILENINLVIKNSEIKTKEYFNVIKFICPTNNGLIPARYEINKIIENILDKKHPLFKLVFLNWKSMVGNYYSSLTDPFEIKSYKEFRNQIRVLYVMLNDPNFLIQLSFQQDILLERINHYLRYSIKLNSAVINKIKFLIK